MAWRGRAIEANLADLLKKEFGLDAGQEHFSHYVNARTNVVENILPEIKAIENNLTDHSADHVGDVLDNAYKLIGEDNHGLSATELYFLCLIVLFHDVGNIHGRKGHYDKYKIMEIYDFAVGTHTKFLEERRLVGLAAAAHSGLATDGTPDTMKELSEQKEGLLGKPIDLRSIAPILRLADELAEGPHRTSDYLVLKGLFASDSKVYHEYAQVTSVFIDRGGGRVALTYNIDVECKDGVISEAEIARLNKLLDCAFLRVIKLNDERRYNKFYSSHLGPFAETTVKFNFTMNRMPVELDLPRIRFTDLMVPGMDGGALAKHYPMYHAGNIIQQLQTQCNPAQQATS